MKPRLTAILLTLATLTLAGCAYAGEVGPPVPVETPDETVRDWVAALAEGELEEAWELVAERSRVAIGGFEAFTELRSALAEGFGVWSSAGDDAFWPVPLAVGGDEALSVVILSGTIAQEGPPMLAASSIPVRTTSEGSLVEPFLDLGEVEGADGDQQRASLEPEVSLEPGPHSLTVVLTTPEGGVATSTALYSVEG